MSSDHNNEMDDNIAIKLEGVSKCFHVYEQPHHRFLQGLFRGRKQFFKEFWALRDISFEVKKGETVGIIGSNGSGKSTLLQIICQILTVTSGSVKANGRIAALLELGSGFNPEFTGHENIYMNGAILGFSQQEIDAHYDDIVAFADIGEFIDQPVKTYSSGMYVRLAFAAQTKVNPDILIVDEALAVGDEKFQRKCFARMEKMKEQGVSILFVSHSAVSVVELCDRAILLENSEHLMTGHPSDVIRAYQKMIYAPGSERESLIAQYKLSNVVKSEQETGVGSRQSQLIETANGNECAFFDVHLVPETTIVYPEQGAKITEIQILDEHGQVVNVLLQGDAYKILVRGKFYDDCQAVHFGLHIRSISGVVVTGQRYPALGQSIEHVRAGENFSVTFSFNMSLLGECYFIGGGIWSENDPSCLHRVMDLVMFRVIQPQGQIFSFGYYDGFNNKPVLSIC